MALLNNVPGDEGFLRRIEHGWYTDAVSFMQDELPKVLVTLLIGFILLRITTFFVKRLRRRADQMVANARRAAQLRTIAGIVRATAFGLIGAYVLLQVLAAVHVPLGPFIASAGVIGLGISFGAQSIFKDVLNGIFILIEDQFNVGDVVKIAGLSGTVEDLTLRCTTLRDGDGTLYIVPNSQIATVSNQSRDFSVATLTVSADASAAPERVMTLLAKLGADVRAEEAFKDVVLGDPSVLGVDKINGREVQYLMNIRVRANQRDGVLREMRRRVLEVFDREHVPLGTASSTLIVSGVDPTAPPAKP